MTEHVTVRIGSHFDAALVYGVKVAGDGIFAPVWTCTEPFVPPHLVTHAQGDRLLLRNGVEETAVAVVAATTTALAEANKKNTAEQQPTPSFEVVSIRDVTPEIGELPRVGSIFD